MSRWPIKGFSYKAVAEAIFDICGAYRDKVVVESIPQKQFIDGDFDFDDTPCVELLSEFSIR